jgi:PAS domain S-box-containing protein
MSGAATGPPDADPKESRVIVLPQTLADGHAIARLFAANTISYEIAGNASKLCAAVREGAGTVVVSEEALLGGASELIACIVDQPVWSDLPIIVLSRAGRESLALSAILPHLGNVSVVERPVRTSTLVSLVRSALRARYRQYQVRSYLAEQERSQQTIREGEQRYRSLIENVSDYAIFMTDLAGHVSSWNAGAEAVLGYATAEVLGDSAEIFSPPDAESGLLAREMERARQVGRSETAGWKARKDGRRLYVEGVMVPVRDERRQLLGYVNFWRDLTEKHRIEIEREQLLDSERAARGETERASRTKDEFLATLSHELRTPLNSILGWTQVARKSLALPDDVRNALTVIDRNARAQAQIIADLLDMSSIISGKVRLDVQRLDLAAVVKATVETVRPAVQAKSIRLQTVLDPLAGPIRGDPNRLQQVLWNVLTNAVKFTPKEGRVAVTLARINSHLELEVTDSGEGIEPAFLPYIFERFRQADASTTRRHGGLGLGLSIVKQLVELHGGSITAHSGGRGQGATFRITLPVMAMSADPTEVEAGRTHPSSPSPLHDLDEMRCESLKGVKVLVVDDEPDARALIQRLLEDCEAIVSTAASADDALTALMRDRPDVLVSDIGMPGEDGYSLVRRVRQLTGDIASVPAIALTAFARIDDRIKAIHAGYQLHLSKPVEAVELVAMVDSLVRKPAGRPRGHAEA